MFRAKWNFLFFAGETFIFSRAKPVIFLFFMHQSERRNLFFIDETIFFSMCREEWTFFPFYGWICSFMCSAEWKNVLSRMMFFFHSVWHMKTKNHSVSHMKNNLNFEKRAPEKSDNKNLSCPSGLPYNSVAKKIIDMNILQIEVRFLKCEWNILFYVICVIQCVFTYSVELRHCDNLTVLPILLVDYS